MKTVLITGSSGQSGREIARLLKDKYHLKGVDIVSGPFTSTIGDLGDWQFVKDVTKNVDYIIHTASLHAPHVKSHARKSFIETNINGTLHLLEAAKMYDVEKLVYTSTTSVYGHALENKNQAVWVNEEVHPEPRDIYDITKLSAEQLCQDFSRSESLSTICLRVARFWNEPDQDRLFYRLFRGLDVRDVAQAHQLALEAEGLNFEIFNISSQSVFDQSELQALKENCHPILSQKTPELLKYYQDRDWQIPSSVDRVYVIDKAKKLLSYQPKYGYKELMQELEN